MSPAKYRLVPAFPIASLSGDDARLEIKIPPNQTNPPFPVPCVTSVASNPAAIAGAINVSRELLTLGRLRLLNSSLALASNEIEQNPNDSSTVITKTQFGHMSRRLLQIKEFDDVDKKGVFFRFNENSTPSPDFILVDGVFLKDKLASSASATSAASKESDKKKIVWSRYLPLSVSSRLSFLLPIDPSQWDNNGRLILTGSAKNVDVRDRCIRFDFVLETTAEVSE